jgi:hypothetical protein
VLLVPDRYSVPLAPPISYLVEAERDRDAPVDDRIRTAMSEIPMFTLRS